ncbi:MAG TPA: TlpA disulfide reductase family protein [Pirellulales bacterium]|nr:TlpA disulfide reductase family protein [Pirellulales bacterium]
MAQETPKATNGRLSDAQAKALALNAHAEAAAMDRLPRLFYEVKSGNGDVATMRNREACSIEGLKEALDGPVAEPDWYQWNVTLAWTEKVALWSTGEREGRRLGSEEVWRRDLVWTKELAFGRTESANAPARFLYAQTPDDLWEGSLRSLAYLRVSPHRFWWAMSDHHDDNISLVPPAQADYRFVATEAFDDELCDIVESSSRAERLWIGRKSGRLHGVLTFRYRGDGPDQPFYQHPRVQKIAGRAFATYQEFGAWHLGDIISSQQKTDIARAWSELYFDDFGPNELIRFRDYREVAPGVWIPFREDRAFTHPAEADRKRHKYIHLWNEVQEARTDMGLSKRVEALRPREGQRVVDRRFGVELDYWYKPERTQSEILALLDAARQKQPVNAWNLRRMMAPIEALLDKPAPALPTEGWIGGPPPRLAGRPYLIHFWAAWSEASKKELPALRELAAQGLPVVGMHPAGTSAEELGKMLDDWQAGYPTYLSSAKMDGDVRKIAGYPVAVIPYCLLVDRKGRVAAHGSLKPELVDKLRALLQAGE